MMAFDKMAGVANKAMLKDMSFGSDLGEHLKKHGYLPEAWVIPPIFEFVHTGGNATGDDRKRPAVVIHAPKHIFGWRDFSLVHTQNFLSLVRAVSTTGFEKAFRAVAVSSNVVSYSIPRPFDSSNARAGRDISRFGELRREILRLAPDFPASAVVDISNCYHSMYSHSLAWACTNPKKLHNDDAAKTAAGQLDKAVRGGMLGRTHGFPVGPRVTDYLAELVLMYADSHIELDSDRCRILRYRDDYYVLGVDGADCEDVIRQLAMSTREVHLRLNGQKTKFQPTLELVLRKWQGDYAALAQRAGISVDEDSGENITLISNRALAEFLRGVIELAAEYQFERAIPERALADLGEIQTLDGEPSTDVVYLLALVADSRPAAMPKALNAISHYVGSDKQANTYFAQMLDHRASKARSRNDEFALAWYSYFYNRATGGLPLALIGADTPLLECLKEFIELRGFGVAPSSIENPLWSKVQTREAPPGVSNWDCGDRAASGYELRYRDPIDQDELDDELMVDFEY